MDQVDFLVGRKDWSQTRLAEAPLVNELEHGQVLLRIDRFALTSNNISYALSGDMLGYWDFFPAPEGWGRIPAMGFADVVQSAHPEVAEGGRYFGFYPMSTHLVVEAQPGGDGFVDSVAHRKDHAPVYRQYSNSGRDPLYEAGSEDQLLLLRGLFMTSFLVEDFVADNDHFGASTLIVSSASSKTSIALAHQASARGHMKVVGLTSPGNAAFVAGLGCYDEVCLYDDIASLPRTASVFVDMAGNAQVVRALHELLGDELKYNCVVGATHWEAGGANEGLPGPTPVFFFAPAQVQKRAKDWGPAELQTRIGAGWRGFRGASDSWLEVVRSAGPEALARVYGEMLGGSTKPSQGQIVSLWS